MLPQCDFVVLTCPLTDTTKHLIGQRELSLMKESATIVNVARGKLTVFNTSSVVLHHTHFHVMMCLGNVSLLFYRSRV